MGMDSKPKVAPLFRPAQSIYNNSIIIIISLALATSSALPEPDYLIPPPGKCTCSSTQHCRLDPGHYLAFEPLNIPITLLPTEAQQTKQPQSAPTCHDARNHQSSMASCHLIRRLQPVVTHTNPKTSSTTPITNSYRYLTNLGQI
ncbi:hypothetical protein F5X96DRAFT_72836 [Biscogniauxia mediterranea]|nr:hypothetical protein F5X96DRAFT_72836 [Biscogniauxia mediterranea]